MTSGTLPSKTLASPVKEPVQRILLILKGDIRVEGCRGLRRGVSQLLLH